MIMVHLREAKFISAEFCIEIFKEEDLLPSSYII